MAYNQILYANPEVFTEINGLPNNEVRCLLKDSKGYLWVGTSYGLAKYDGNKFTVFKHQSNRNSISGDVITAIFEDDKGNILVGANGLSIFSRSRGVWRNFLHDPGNPNAINNPSVTSITQQNDSIYWVITSNGINKFNINTERFQPLNIDISNRIINSKIHSFLGDTAFLLSLGTQLYRYNYSKGFLQKLTYGTGYYNAKLFNDNLIGAKIHDPNILSLVRWDFSNGQEQEIYMVTDATSALFTLNKILYFVSANRIVTFNNDFSVKEVVFINTQPHEQTYEFSCAVKDENGIFWIGTPKGLLKIVHTSPFQFIDRNKGLVKDYIRSLAIDSNGNLWVGVRQGPVYVIEKIDDFLLGKYHRIKKIEFPTPNGQVYATNRILELRDGNMLLVTHRMLYHYNTFTGSFTSQFNIPNNNQYFSAIEVDDGVVIGSIDKPTLFKIKIIDGVILHDKSFNTTRYLEPVYALHLDSEKNIWIGSEGLYKISSPKKTKTLNIESVIPAINDTNYSSNSFWSLTDIDKNYLVATTTNNGLYQYNKITNRFRHISKSEGLSSDFTCTALKDKNNNIWVSTKEGITFIESNSFELKNYPVRNGHFKSDFTFKCGVRTPGNFLLFGSKQGIVYFHPDIIIASNYESNLIVNEFRVFDRVARRELTQGDTITLRHDRNFFTFEFSLLDFRNPQDTRYTFQLLNYDKTEREVTNNYNAVSYTNVPPGNYTFKLSSNNIWDANSEKTVSIVLIVQPAFYQTTWFKILLITVIAIIVASIVVAIIRRQFLRVRLQKMELDLLRSQINPHFIFNTLTSIQHTILTNSKSEAIDILSRFAKLMRMFLDYTRLEFVPLDKAISFFETYVAVHSVNLEEKIDFAVNVDKRIDIQSVKVSPMLIQPFIENSIVHGLSPKGKDMKLRVDINLEEGYLLCIIDDNGIGRKRAMEIGAKKRKDHKSMGIEISSKSILLQLKRTKFTKESFSIIDKTDYEGNAIGTIVYLKIPFYS